MYEIRKAGRIYRIYDKINKKYIAHTIDEDKANTTVSHLHIKGWEGNIPAFMLAGLKYGINMD
jgi:hypothetical protein